MSRSKSRLDELYITKLRLELQKELGKVNIMEVPQLGKIVVNVGVKEAVKDSRVLQKVVDVVSKITGQIPVKTKAKKSIASFKVREGMPLGVKVTLRRKNMYEFLDRLINLALPKVRDFQGISIKFDRQGNYNLGIREWNIFPEADREELVHGLNVTFDITTKNPEEGYALLKSFGMPFKQKTR